MKNKHLLYMLLGVLCVMGIGFAAFSQQLTINGSATITSNWDVEITGITTTQTVGGAKKAIEPIYSKTTATFKTELISPKDSMTYRVTITNNGTIDAKVSNITINDSNNPAIVNVLSGININDLLKAGESSYYDIKVTYSDSVTSQPDELESSLTVKLDYVQA